jgi:hypothetical protein
MSDLLNYVTTQGYPQVPFVTIFRQHVAKGTQAKAAFPQACKVRSKTLEAEVHNLTRAPQNIYELLKLMSHKSSGRLSREFESAGPKCGEMLTNYLISCIINLSDEIGSDYFRRPRRLGWYKLWMCEQESPRFWELPFEVD